MLQNAYFLAKIGADTAENEQHFAEILPTDAVVRRAAAPGLLALSGDAPPGLRSLQPNVYSGVFWGECPRVAAHFY